MPKKYIQPGVTAGDLYDTINSLTGLKEDGGQGETSLGDGAIVIKENGQVVISNNNGPVLTTVQNSNQLGNKPASYYGAAADTIATYTHSLSGGYHNLTGTGNNIKFLATANYNGEGVKVNGVICTPKTITGENIWTGFFKSGNIVSCFKNGTILNFNGAAGLSEVDKQKLTADNIKTGISITTGGLNVTGTFTADGNITSEQVLNNYVGYSKGNRIVGNIPISSHITNCESVQYVSGGSSGSGLYTRIPKGAYLSIASSGYPEIFIPQDKVAQTSSINSSVIKSGTTVLGVAGTFSSDATANGNQILSGYTAYAKGNKITGNIPSLGSMTITPSSQNQVIGPGYYLNSAVTIRGDSNLQPQNIKKGVTIFGVTGQDVGTKATVATANYACVLAIEESDKTYDTHLPTAGSCGAFDSNYGYLQVSNTNPYPGSAIHAYIKGWTNDFWIKWVCTRAGTYTIITYGQGTFSHNGTKYFSYGETVTLTFDKPTDIYWRDTKSGGFTVHYEGY